MLPNTPPFFKQYCINKKGQNFLPDWWFSCKTLYFSYFFLSEIFTNWVIAFKKNTKRVLFSQKMPHLCLPIFEIINLNKKKMHKYIDYQSQLNTCTFIFIYIFVKTMKFLNYFCQMGEILPNLVSLNKPCHIKTDQLSQSI